MRSRPTEDRFWSKAIESEDGCWEWQAARNANGYGIFWDGQRTGVAHRFAYETLIGEVPVNLELDHLCRNRRCVNPWHLDPVTRSVNIRRGLLSSNPVNSRKTHCPRGHPYDHRNTYVDRRGYRTCRACGLASYHRRKGLRGD